MIPVRELRIGNKFKMAGSNIIQTVFDISDNTDRGRIEFQSEEHKAMYSHLITVEENGNQYKPFEMEGIPLSEDWLLKFGFQFRNERRGEGALMDLKTAGWNMCVGKLRGREGWTHLGSDRVDITSVHQLQNLFFAITGEELAIKQSLTPLNKE
jgi:hypothetical protein